MKHKILAIIPARGGSKGVKRKNLRILGNKSLINWSIEEVKKSKLVNKIVVSTEDDEIAKVSENAGVCIIKRPMELALDDSPTIDAIIYTLDKLKKQNYIPEYVMLLQCTTPFRKSTDIDNAIKLLIENEKKADSLISVSLEESIPYWLKTIDNDGFLNDFIKYDKKKFARRQDFKKVYRLNGAIYISKIDKIYENRSFESRRTISYIMDKQSSIDIDTENDLRYAEFILNNNINYRD